MHSASYKFIIDCESSHSLAKPTDWLPISKGRFLQFAHRALALHLFHSLALQCADLSSLLPQSLYPAPSQLQSERQRAPRDLIYKHISTAKAFESSFDPHTRTSLSLTASRFDDGRLKVKTVSECLNDRIAESFALFVKTQNYHWHDTGSHFRGAFSNSLVSNDLQNIICCMTISRLPHLILSIR